MNTSGPLRLNAFGRLLIVERVKGQWLVLDAGNDGKRRIAEDIVIPATLGRADIMTYLNDLLHESATASQPTIVCLE